MKTILILLDSLNRHYLSLYGGWVKTPNIDRLAARGLVFENHTCGSLPCMPARRDMLTGRLSFLEAGWAPIEPWDDCLPVLLRQQRQVYSHLITDHYHYFHSGGEAYHTLFDTYEFERGQEGDNWRPFLNTPVVPKTSGKGAVRKAYWANRQAMDPEDDLAYSTPRCFQRAIEFVDAHHNADDWHLHLELFDPHEPFDCPQRYIDLYNDRWERDYLYNWPQYGPLNPELDDPEAVRHVRARYAGTLSMADAWLGKLLDRLDALDLWKDTTVILTTDHGHLLGEHDFWGKNQMFDYNELARIPLMVAHPGTHPGRITQGLTNTIDLMPAILELHGAQPTEWVRGKSLVHLLEKDGIHHAAVLYGYHAKDINLTDGHYTCCRQPLLGTAAYQFTAMPRGFADFLPRELLARSEMGVFLPHAYGIPHYKIPIPSRRHTNAPEINPIVYDIQADPGQTAPVLDLELAARLDEQMRELLRYHDAPENEFKRVGLI